ncbi:MAG: beta-ketoacyl-[acyl-carrier-protein] synthase family protein [Planctomycetota bacterium]
MDSRNRHRVVVTGIGAVSCLGESAPEMWSNLVAGKSGIRRISVYDCSGYPITIAGEIPTFDAMPVVGRDAFNEEARHAHLAVGAAKEAARQAGLDWENGDFDGAGVVIANAHGRFDRTPSILWQAMWRGPDAVDLKDYVRMSYEGPCRLVSQQLQATGPRFVISSACVSGAKAIERATRYVRRGQCEVCVVGGAEAIVDEYCTRFLHAMRALTTHDDNPKHASRPFDRERSGFVMAEGAGIMILETLEHAKKRGANILAEVAGVGGSANATSLYAPEEIGEGPASAMQAALRDGGLSPDVVDCVFAHATATDVGDPAEARGIAMVFGDRSKGVAVTAPKGGMGHAIGASGALAGVNCVQAIMHQAVPPILNCDDPIEETADLDLIRYDAQERKLRYVLNNAFGFGGANGTNIFTVFED